MERTTLSPRSRSLGGRSISAQVPCVLESGHRDHISPESTVASVPLNSTGEGASVWRREEEGEQTSAYRTQCRRLVRPLIFVLFPGPVNLGTVDSGGHFVLDCRVLSVHPVHCGPSSCLPGLPPLRVSSTPTPVCGDQKRDKEAQPLLIVIVHRGRCTDKGNFPCARLRAPCASGKAPCVLSASKAMHETHKDFLEHCGNSVWCPVRAGLIGGPLPKLYACPAPAPGVSKCCNTEYQL